MKRFDWEGLADLLLDKMCDSWGTGTTIEWLKQSGYTDEDLERMGLIDWENKDE